MGLWARRVLALVGVAAALLLSAPGGAVAETTTPTPAATATTRATPDATPRATADPSDDEADTPDVPLDDTRTILVLVGAGVLALVAGAVVFLRR